MGIYSTYVWCFESSTSCFISARSCLNSFIPTTTFTLFLPKSFTIPSTKESKSSFAISPFKDWNLGFSVGKCLLFLQYKLKKNYLKRTKTQKENENLPNSLSCVQLSLHGQLQQGGWLDLIFQTWWAHCIKSNDSCDQQIWPYCDEFQRCTPSL